METLGYVLAGLALLAVVAVAAAGLVIRNKLRTQGKALTGALGSELPCEISLIPCAMPTRDKELMSRVEALERLGFTRTGCFDVEPMDGVLVVGLIHEQDRLTGTIYRHHEAGIWTDLVAMYDTAGSLTVTNAQHNSESDHRPAHHKLYEPPLDESDLLDLLRRRMGARPRQAVNAGDFRAYFENHYAADMEWRGGRSGANLEEIERVAANLNGEFNAREIARARAVLAARITPDLDKKVRDAFAATMTGVEWERAQRRGVIVRADQMLGDVEAPIYDALEEAELLARYEETLEACWEDSLDGEASLNTIVTRINAVLPQEHRFALIAEIHEPIEARLFVLQ